MASNLTLHLAQRCSTSNCRQGCFTFTDKKKELLDELKEQWWCVRSDVAMEEIMYSSALLAAIDNAEAMVPNCNTAARGTPKNWNNARKCNWGKKVRRWYPSVKGAMVDINKIVSFLFKRPGPDGRAVMEKIGGPAPYVDGWFRCPWLDFHEDNLRTESPGALAAVPGKADWQRAWHGCKIEGLYSIMYYGNLFASQDAARGDRFFEGAPGVYVHKDSTVEKRATTFALCTVATTYATNQSRVSEQGC